MYQVMMTFGFVKCINEQRKEMKVLSIFPWSRLHMNAQLSFSAFTANPQAT